MSQGTLGRRARSDAGQEELAGHVPGPRPQTVIRALVQPGHGYRTSLYGGTDPFKRDASGARTLPNRTHAAPAPTRPRRPRGPGVHAAPAFMRPRTIPAPGRADHALQETG